MKHWLLFVGGLLVGGAAGLLVGGAGGGEENDSAEGGENRKASTVGSGISSSDSGGSGRRPGRGGRGGRPGGLGAPASPEDLLAYLKLLESVEDFEEVNFMQLLRQGSYVTTMSEREVTDLLQLLVKKDEEAGEDDDDGEMMQMFSGLLFTRYMELNGPEAMKMLMAGELGPRWEGDEDELLTIGMSSWVDADPEGAIKWFRGGALADPKYREMFEDSSVQSAFFAAMSRHSGQEAMKLAQEAGGDIASDSMEVIARHEQSVEGLEQMLRSTEGDSQLEVFQVMSHRDAQRAARWLAAAQLGEGRDDYVEAVASSMMEDDLEGGVQWYMRQELTTTEGRKGRLTDIVGELAADDPIAANTWLEGQPDTPERDAAEVRIARLATNSEDWQSSFRWVAEVGDAGQRLETVNWVLQRGWDRRQQTMNPEAAEAAQNAGFGEELSTYIENNSK